MATNVDMEFDVDMECDECVNKVKAALDKLRIKNPLIDLKKQSVVVHSHLPFSKIIKAIEKTGLKAFIKGVGGEKPDGQKQESAVAEIEGEQIKGVVRFSQANNTTCIIDGTIDGLTTGEHYLHIHEFGDLSDGFNNFGPFFDPGTTSEDSSLDDVKRQYGDLGSIMSNANNHATFRIEDNFIKVYDIIGRSLTLCEPRKKSKGGTEAHPKVDGNCNNTVAAGVIARSAGLFQNPKRICLCDGTTIWEEKSSFKPADE